MNCIEYSNNIRENHPARLMSISRRKLVHGIAINDADYTVCPTIGRKKVCCPAYISWHNMLMRVFSSAYHEKQPTYIGCTVDDEWLKFSIYRKWWVNNSVDGWHLDKDFILPGNKHYSKENCIFIPHWLSAIVSGHESKRGEFPIGVTYDKRYGLYVARCFDPRDGKKKYIGGFVDPESAALAYKERKLFYIDAIRDRIDAIDKRLYYGIVACVNMKS